MKAFLVLAVLVAATAAQEYGPSAYTPQSHKNVFVFSAPDEPEDRQARTIRIPGGDSHTNVILVKTPSSSSSHQTEVVLPEQDEHKNLVYVLLKKGESNADVKITRPQPKTPQKPEVHFIRYGGKAGYGAGAGGSSGGSFGGFGGF